MPGPFDQESIQIGSMRATSALACRDGDSRLEPGHALEAETSQYLFVAIKAQRHEQIEIRINQPEPLGHHANDLPWLRIDCNAASNHRWISAEAALPVPVAQHDRLRTMRILLRGQQPAAKQRRHSERLQHAVGDRGNVDLMWLGQAGHICCRPRSTRPTIETSGSAPRR